MKSAGFVRSTYLIRLSQPPQDRCLYRTIWQTKTKSILEMGVGDGVRTDRMLELALAQRAASDVRYTGIDQFEARPAQSPGMTLKCAYRQFTATGAQVRLIPGDPQTVLSKKANHLGQFDLVVIRADQSQDALADAWFYFPRILQARSLVFIERSDAAGRGQFEQIELSEITRRAQAVTISRRRAA